MAADATQDVSALTNDPVVNEAIKRWDLVSEWEANARERFLDDIKFANADADNGWQWPNAIKRLRDVDQRPCLTLNITRQHNLQIINAGKQNKQGVNVRATGNGATVESANVLKAIIRHIEYQSRAQDAYATAREFQIQGGIGWWRIVTDYIGGDGADAFDQEIYLRRIWDPLSVYCDPDCQEKDKSDMNYAFVFDLLPEEDFKKAYPKYADLASLAPLGVNTGADITSMKQHVRVCEYFRRVRKKDQVISFIDPQTQGRKTIRKSKLAAEHTRAVLDAPLSRIRDVWDNVVEWYLIVGEKVVDQTEWMGSYIPLICILGEETVIDGILDRKGHTRAMKDAQRMFNYNAASQVEFVAMQGKSPWVAPVAAIEDLEEYYRSANQVNHSVLPYKHIDDEGNPIPGPTKPNPPMHAPAYQAGMDTAFNQMMMTSGQWQNQMGMQGNERTGAAIKARQGQGDTATYHFEDNFRVGIVNCGRQLIELIPKIYDTKRVLQIQADDGTDMEIEIDPTARQAYLQEVQHNQEVVRRVFNPNLGKYDVEADMGPAWGTKRDETREAMALILTQAPGLTGIIGDLMLDSLDFDKAQEAAQRLKRMVPAQALGHGPSQAEQQLQQQVQSLSTQLAKIMEQYGKDKIKLVGKGEMRDIDAFNAITQRAKVFLDHGIESTQLAHEIAQNTLEQIGPDNQEEIDPGSAPEFGLGSLDSMHEAPVKGALQATNGSWYLSDPTRRGRYLRIGPLAQNRALPKGTV